ncbi:hypothetical protein [Microbacterium sp.]|uniref:hypothetical protein n=1 Tax=Microbacterium sp. TaxID=51671 RepID=UPI003C743E8F
MPKTDGYVGTIEAESRDVSRLWFSLTDAAAGSDWVKIGGHRAWFTMSMESDDRPTHLAQLSLLLEAMRNGLAVRVSHGGAAAFQWSAAGDSFEVDGVRILRSGLQF